MPTATEDKLAPYKFHGVALRMKGGEAIGTCPFCDKENHFFVSPKTGQYQCKVSCCDEAIGNVYSFLAKIHADALKRTKKSDYERLSSLRDNMPWQIFRDAGFAFSKEQNRWLLPINNQKGALANLCVYAPPKIDKLRGTESCAQHMYLADKINPTGPIYLCEGQWDAMALKWLLEKNNLDPSLWSVLGCPGSNSFKKEWAELLKNRDVFMFFDKDTAGQTGMDRIVELCGSKSRLRRISWPSELPEGYDVRDFVSHKADKPKAAWTALQSLFPEKNAGEVVGKARPKLIRTKFDQVVKDFKKAIHVDKAWIDALAVSMAVVVSGKLKNDPLWLFMVGPPGSGKTLLVESFLNHKSGTVYMSKITRQSLVSGFRGEEDYSVLPTLNGKCFIVKDFTAVLAMPLQAQIEIFGILRDVYDGHCTVPFGNMEPKVFNDLYFSNISSVTDVIRKYNLADLGERFLKLELLDESHDPKVHIRSALSSIEDNIGEKAAQEGFLRDSVAAFMERPFDEKKLPKLPEWLKERLINLAQLGANLRAVVAKSSGDLSYRPRPEVGTRLAKCLGKLARCLCWVFDKKKIDEDIYALVSKVACDTVLGWDIEILHAMYQSGNAGMTLADIGIKMQLSHSGIDRRLENLQHLNIVYKTETVRRDGRGRKYYIWHLADHIKEMWKEANLEYAPPPVVKFKTRGGYKPKRPAKPTKAKSKTLPHIRKITRDK